MQFSINKDKKGFTIIEVMIVLAIAALILLVVFLAVPALQRSQRNNARKADASRVAAAIVDFTSTNQGNLPATAADCTTIYNSAASLSQFTGLTCQTPAAFPATPTANNFYTATTAANYTGSSPAISNVMMLGEGVVCSGSNALTTTGATTKSMGLLYSLESGSTYTWACVNPQ